MVLCFSQLGDWIASSFGKLETKLGKQLEERLIPRWNSEFLSQCEPPPPLHGFILHIELPVIKANK